MKTTWLLGFFLILSPVLVSAESSNQKEVRAGLAKGGYSVAYGKMWTEVEWYRSGEAIGASVASGNPGPFAAYMAAEIQQSAAKIARQVPGLTVEQVRRLIDDSLKNKRVAKINNVYLSAGIVTYDRWKEVSMDWPVMDRYGRLTMERKEHKQNLPNWHQPYVRFRIGTVGGGNDPNGPTAPPKNWGPRVIQLPGRVPVRPKSIRVHCLDKQEASGDSIVLIVRFF